MELHKLSILFLLGLLIPSGAIARDEVILFPIVDPMETSTAQSFEGIEFRFGGTKYGTVRKSWGTFTSRKTTNATFKPDKTACDWAFLSAMKSLWERAHQEGGNAVVNIKSVTTGAKFSSESEYQCRAGNIIAKVYLEGEVVLKK